MLIKIYSKLHSHFGSQHWWPVTKEKELVPKYHQSIKLNPKQKLEICFGAILTQNTNWKNVEKAIIQLNKHQLISIKKILKIDNKKLAEVIRSSGYHNQKAIKLKNFCYFLSKNYNGNLNLFFKNNIEKLRKELLEINGIGPETADSIILYAAEKPIFVIDAYTKRVYSRIFNIKRELKYEELQKIFEKSFKKEAKLFNECHALLVELGKNVCKKVPLCNQCPINNMCNYYKTLNTNNN
ncbi:endonuclease III domain-containing protein [Candidatus Woesearchaeota archaeon]|nr:endonuclease III domain-containing protein [Candidatus Woesearchaeota archaeon]